MLHVAQAASKLSTMKQRMGAAILKNGRVMGVGYNRMGSTKRSPAAWSRHAELQAIIAAGDVRGSTIYVYRGHGQTGSPMLARPCATCFELLDEAGVRRVVYSTPTGPVKEMV
jgi:deoxycytidylate deaminase